MEEYKAEPQATKAQQRHNLKEAAAAAAAADFLQAQPLQAARQLLLQDQKKLLMLQLSGVLLMNPGWEEATYTVLWLALGQMPRLMIGSQLPWCFSIPNQK
jgi:hypothetical protein